MAEARQISDRGGAKVTNCLAEANYHPEGPSNGLVADLRGLSVLENGALWILSATSALAHSLMRTVGH